MNALASRFLLLWDRLSGKSIFQSAGYREAELTRLLNLFAHVDLARWKGMRVLEVGAGLGHLGDYFEHLGFEVTSTDARPENVQRMHERGRRSFVLDLDADEFPAAGEFDLVLAFGVLYHLQNPQRFLQACGASASVLLLETVVSDSETAVAPIVAERQRVDQAMEGYGSRPSASWIDATCRAAGFETVHDISNPAGNWKTGKFDWEPRGEGAWRRDGYNFRKMWVCEKAARPSANRPT